MIVNREPTHLDDLADLVINAEIGPTLDAADSIIARIRRPHLISSPTFDNSSPAFSNVLKSGATLVIVNREPTHLDDLADLVINAEIGPTLDAAVNWSN